MCEEETSVEDWDMKRISHCRTYMPLKYRTLICRRRTGLKE